MSRKVVFHVAENNQWDRVFPHLNNITNDDSNIEVVVVALSSGVDAVLKGYKREKEILELTDKYNITFKICKNSMRGNDISKDQLIDGVEIVSSGIIEVIDRQMDSFSYIRP